MNATDLEQQIRAALAAVAPEADLAQLDPEAAFRDQFELDSVDFLNFILDLEQRLGRRIPEVDYPKLASLAGCLAYLQD